MLTISCTLTPSLHKQLQLRILQLNLFAPAAYSFQLEALHHEQKKPEYKRLFYIEILDALTDIGEKQKATVTDGNGGPGSVKHCSNQNSRFSTQSSSVLNYAPGLQAHEFFLGESCQLQRGKKKNPTRLF